MFEMLNIKFFVFISMIFLTSCIQDGAQINYKEKNDTKTTQNTLQPSYMRGTYVTTADNRVVRDLKKENNYEDDDNYRNNEEIEEYERQYTQEKKIRKIRVVEVETGDSLLGLSRKYNMTLSEIAELNNKKPPYNIYVGQKIKVYDDGSVEKTTATKTSVPKYKTIVVKSGDNLSKIAFENNSTSRELAEINNIKPPYNVYVGQKLKVPTNGKENNYYIVETGDNLYSISKKNDIKFTELVRINNLSKPYKIYVGQRLLLKQTSATKKATQNEPKRVEVVKNNVVSKNTNNEVVKEEKQSNNIVMISDSVFMWPTSGEIIKRFGKQPNGEFSDAINIKAVMNSNVVAAAAGEVAYAGNELKGYGNMIIIKHDNGWLSIYGHCNSMNVNVKDRVERGQIIAKIGKTGNVSEPQLYFAVRKGKVAMDPLKYLSSK